MTYTCIYGHFEVVKLLMTHCQAQIDLNEFGNVSISLSLSLLIQVSSVHSLTGGSGQDSIDVGMGSWLQSHCQVFSDQLQGRD
jgi:hypothetical protein